MKTILVTTDFSPAALNAAKYAKDMAVAIDADILLLHVYQMPISYGEIPSPVALNPEDMRQDAEKKINELKQQLIPEKGSINIKAEVRMGAFPLELQVICESIRPYAVIMGSQGTTAGERLLLGSHTIYAMKHLMWPLIAVPQGASFSTVKKIGLACDFDKVVDITPVDEIKTLVNDFNAELHVLNTGRRDVFKPELVFESGLIQEMLETLKPEYHFITNENTENGILDFVEKNHIDLLIVLPKRHSLLDKLIHKSHTKQLILHSRVPVMAFHK
jgi:nucleotide-binding universal stress UspA family protein